MFMFNYAYILLCESYVITLEVCHYNTSTYHMESSKRNQTMMLDAGKALKDIIEEKVEMKQSKKVATKIP
jgi:hypothetical protein